MPFICGVETPAPYSLFRAFHEVKFTPQAQPRKIPFKSGQSSRTFPAIPVSAVCRFVASDKHRHRRASLRRQSSLPSLHGSPPLQIGSVCETHNEVLCKEQRRNVSIPLKSGQYVRQPIPSASALFSRQWIVKKHPVFTGFRDERAKKF